MIRRSQPKGAAARVGQWSAGEFVTSAAAPMQEIRVTPVQWDLPRNQEHRRPWMQGVLLNGWTDSRQPRRGGFPTVFDVLCRMCREPGMNPEVVNGPSGFRQFRQRLCRESSGTRPGIHGEAIGVIDILTALRSLLNRYMTLSLSEVSCAKGRSGPGSWKIDLGKVGPEGPSGGWGLDRVKPVAS